jgi:hypothetical protein
VSALRLCLKQPPLNIEIAADPVANTLDTTAINVRKPKRSRVPESAEEPTGKKRLKPKKKKP